MHWAKELSGRFGLEATRSIEACLRPTFGRLSSLTSNPETGPVNMRDKLARQAEASRSSGRTFSR